MGTRLRELRDDLDTDKFKAIFARFKEVAEKKNGRVDGGDLELEFLVSDQAGSMNESWRVTGLQATAGLSGIPTATVDDGTQWS